MSAAKDKDGRWYCKFRYKDWQGKTVQKKKIGFATKKAAQEWESEFLAKASGSPDMTFQSLWELYLEDMKKRAKESSVVSFSSDVRTHLLPTFGKKQISEITPIMVRNWYNNAKGTASSKKKHKRILSAIMNYGVNFYGLNRNPVLGAISKKETPKKEMAFWTLDQFQTFIDYVDNPMMHCLFNLLFYSGIRLGEAQALTRNDLHGDSIQISKTYADSVKKIQTTKTEAGTRTVTIPPSVMQELRQLCTKIYDLNPSDRIFFVAPPTIRNKFAAAIKAAGVPKIRIHDLRHSHASLLIQLGYPILVVSKRLGHANPSITLNTYSHLYPSMQSEVSVKLEKLKNGTEVVQKK